MAHMFITNIMQYTIQRGDSSEDELIDRSHMHVGVGLVLLSIQMLNSVPQD